MSKISRWGNSLGVRLPKELAATAGLKAGTSVRVRLMDNGTVVIAPVSGLVTEIIAKKLPKTTPNTAEW